MRIGPNGLPRYHFREAMKGVLPENVRIRASKVQFNKPNWLTLIDTVNACLRDKNFDDEKKAEFIAIKKDLQANDAQNLNNRKIKKLHRRLFLEIWKNQMENSKSICSELHC
jgi:asparagine synthase (glutamine-hydrolysing)